MRLLALLAAGAAGSAGSLVAQAAGLPVRNAGVGTGIGIAADVGFPNAAGGKGFAAGLTGAAGIGLFGVTGTLGRFDPEGGDNAVTTIGATGNLRILGGPLIPLAVTLQAGIGRYRSGSVDVSQTVSHFPLGLGIALTIPNPVFSIKPWVAPRIDVEHSTTVGLSGSHGSTDTHFGISGGVDLGFLNGLTVRAMYDRVQAGSSGHPSILSLGLGFRVGK